ncbi:RHS repeat-associated core domain-containing protein [Pleionea sp. CnH1-48]|uniref:RHS repeat-associated core domain-containing protein n=1 Tax=Pleionea sp. CnH1-48 TaxID=2954494 RepID=UPI002096F1EC|nr:RHS repeat-associated core domain-containing protein [Pleionea sp. CnH1-48]MCO7222728.1 cysteine peptidase family C39 domain-containing protein [Pleionea sp. CnH1-48]
MKRFIKRPLLMGIVSGAALLCQWNALASSPTNGQTGKPETRSQYSQDVLKQVRPSLKAVGELRNPTVNDVMASGQLGGILHPNIDTSQNAESLALSRGGGYALQNSAFAKAMDEWNQHNYKEAFSMMEDYLKRYPNGLWAGEADLHMGCEARFNGRYREANERFSRIVKKYENHRFEGARKVAEKAKSRLAVLRVMENNLPAAEKLFAELHKEGTDWRQRTYASQWVQRIARLKQQGKSLADCGTQALSHVLAQKGLDKEAQTVSELKPSVNQGFTIQSLKEIAGRYEQPLTALHVQSTDLERIPLPAIAHIDRQDTGGLGHYWIVESADDKEVVVFDKQKQRRFKQSLAEFEREWSGRMLVFAEAKGLPGTELSLEEALSAYGGCCGIQRPEDELGSSCKVGARGCPRWSINPINMNLFVTDTPLWYETPYGPDVDITVSYNAQSALAQHEPVGNKWMLNLSSYVVEDPGNTVTVFMPDGERKVFTKNHSTGHYDAALGGFETLTKISEQHYQLRFKDGTTYHYTIPAGTQSQQPLLTKISDVHGFALTLGYNSDIQLISLTDAQQRVTTFEYYPSGKVKKVTDPFQRSALFGYSNDGDLTAITDMGGYTSTLQYDANKYVTLIDFPDLGAYQFVHEPADGDRSGGTVFYPAPGQPMWEAYRVTVIDPEQRKTEYHFNGSSNWWMVRPEHYIEYVDQQVNNGNNPNKVSFSVRPLTDSDSEIDRRQYPDGRQGGRHFDDKGRVIAVWRSDKVDRGFEYNANNQVAVIKPDNQTEKSITITYVNETLNLPATVTYPVNGNGYQRVVEYAYDANFFIERITEKSIKGDAVDTRVTDFTVNADGQIISVDGPRSDVQDISYFTYYDCTQGVAFCGQVETITNALGHVTRYSNYTLEGKPQTIEEPNNLTTQLTYDDLGRIETYTQTDASGGSETLTLTYHGVKRIKSIVHSSGLSMHYTYKANGEIDSITNNTGEKVALGFDKNGNVTDVDLYDALHTKVGNLRYRYDVGDKLQSILRSDSPEEKIEYDAAGQFGGVTDALGNRVNVSINGLNQITKFDVDYKEEITFDYDRTNNLVGVTDGEGYYTDYTYNGFGEVIKRQSDNTGITLYQYDEAGNLTQITDARNTQATFTYDALNRVTQVDYPGTAEDVVYTWDNTDNGNFGVGRLTSVQDESGVQHYIYDSVGRVIQQSHTLYGVTLTTQYAYNARGQLEVLTYPSGTAIQFYYDALGRVESVKKGNQTLASDIRYLPFGPMLSMTYGNQHTFNRNYNSDYRMEGLTHSDISAQSFSYTARNNMASINDSINAAYNRHFHYDVMHRLTGIEYPDHYQSLRYNQVGNRLGLAECIKNSTDMQSYQQCATFYDTQYENCISSGECVAIPPCDPAQDPSCMPDGCDPIQDPSCIPDCDPQIDPDCGADGGTGNGDGGGDTPTPDEICPNLDTLCTMVPADVCQSYQDFCAANGYSASSNPVDALIQKANAQTAITSAQSTAVNHRYTHYDYALMGQALSAASQKLMTYDAAGNLLTRENEVYEYNHHGRVQRITTDTDVLEFVYNAQGLRIVKIANGVATLYTYDLNGKLLAEYNAQGQVIKEYVYLNDEPLALIENGQRYFYHNDHLGTPIALTNSQKAIVWQAQYDVFGQANISNHGIENNLRFAGQYFDSESGLHYNWHRYYDPKLGRYITSDPIGLAGGINTYVYALNNPVKHVDPTGQAVPLILWGLGSAALNFGIQMAKNDFRVECVNWWEVGVYGVVGAGGGIMSQSARFHGGLWNAIKRFFWDNRRFRAVSSRYWRARGGANGNSLDHWAIGHARANYNTNGNLPAGLVNAGWNLVRMPFRMNSYLGGFGVRNTFMAQLRLRIARVAATAFVPISAASAGVGGYYLGSNAFNYKANCECN